MSNPLKVLVDLQARRNVLVSGTLEVTGSTALAGGVTVTGGAVNASAVAVTASSLLVSNGATISGGLGVNGTTSLGVLSGSSANFTGDFTARTGSFTGDLTVTGNLTINGTTTNINTTNLLVEDKNIVIADVATPTDITADGAGITIKGNTDKLFRWLDGTDSFTSSEHMDLASGKSYKINGVDVLTSNTLGSGVVTSSLTSLGVLTSLSASGHTSISTLSASAISGTQGDFTSLFINGVAVGTGNGSGTVASGSAGKLAFYPSTGTTVDDAAGLTYSSDKLAISGSSSSALALEVTGAISANIITASNGVYVSGGTLNASAVSVSASALNVTNDIVGLQKIYAAVTGALSTAVTGADSGSGRDLSYAAYLLDQRITSISSSLGPSASAITSAYQAVRVVTTGSISGDAYVELTALKAGFDVGSLDYISLDVVVKSGSAGDWQNDLVAVHLNTGSGAGSTPNTGSLYVTITALSEATNYRLIAVNEKPGKFTI